MPVVSQWLNGLPQSPFQLRLSLIGSKLIRNEPLSQAETDSLTQRERERRRRGGGSERMERGGVREREAQINRREVDEALWRDASVMMLQVGGGDGGRKRTSVLVRPRAG